MSYIELMVLSSFDMFMIVYIVLTIRNRFDKAHVQKGLFGIIMGAIIGSSGYYIEYQAVSLTINILLGLIIIKFIVKSNIKDTIVTYTYSLTLLYTAQLLITLIVSIFIKDFEYSFINGLIIQMVTIVICILVLKSLPIKRIYQLIVDKNKLFGVITINIFVVYYVLMMLWYTSINRFLENMIGTLIVVVLILLINTIMLTKGYKNQMMTEKMKMYDTYFPVIENIIEEIRTKQHDYHNHIQAFKALNTELLHGFEHEKYIERLSNDEIWSKLIKLDNKILMAFLYSKFAYAQSNNVIINYEISNYLFETNIQNYDLIEIFGILIDNALEAASRNSSNQIYVGIGFEHSKNIIETKNKSSILSSNEIQQMFNDNYKPETSKNHGYGLKKLRCFLNENYGTIFVEYDTVESEILFRVEIPTLLQ